MKRTTAFASPSDNDSVWKVAVLIIGIFFITSCIYDAPDDSFYRTLWTASYIPACINDVNNEVNREASPDLSGLTLEFLCGCCVKATAPGASGSYGTYETSGHNACFYDLNLSYYNDGSPIVIILEEAHRTNDLLSVTWRYSGSKDIHQSEMRRLSSYEQPQR